MQPPDGQITVDSLGFLTHAAWQMNVLHVEGVVVGIVVVVLRTQHWMRLHPPASHTLVLLCLAADHPIGGHV